MNVIRFADGFQGPPRMGEGLAPTIYYLSESQASQGLKIYVICRRRLGEECFETMRNIEVHRVGPPFSIKMLCTFLNLAGRMNVDIVHAHATSGFSYAISRKLWNLFSGRFVSHVHGTTKGIMLSWKQLKGYHSRSSVNLSRDFSVLREGLIWRNSDGLLTNSHFLKKELAELYGVEEKRIHVIHNGVDLRVFQSRESAKEEIIKKHGLKEDSKVVLYLGGARLVKGPLILLEAFKSIHNEMSEATLLFVGKALKNQVPSSFRRLITALEEKKALLFLDKIPYLELPYYYSAADVVTVPSVYDTFPKVVLEALACGTSVVASDVGGISEIITNKKTGLLCEPGNSFELAEVTTSILTDNSLKERLRTYGRELVKEKFTWEKVAERCMKAYKEILTEN